MNSLTQPVQELCSVAACLHLLSVAVEAQRGFLLPPQVSSCSTSRSPCQLLETGDCLSCLHKRVHHRVHVFGYRAENLPRASSSAGTWSCCTKASDTWVLEVLLCAFWLLPGCFDGKLLMLLLLSPHLCSAVQLRDE